MATVSNEQFLFSCIDNSNGGTVNWAKVAQECNIVSKGAAAIKFKRLKDKFGTAGNAATSENGATDGDDGEAHGKKKTIKKKPKAPVKKSPTKKRKLSEDEADDEMTSPVKEEHDDDEDS